MRTILNPAGTILIMALILVGAIESRAQNLLGNGSFETPLVTNATKAMFPATMAPWQTATTNFEIWTNGWDNPAAGIARTTSADGGQNLEILPSGSNNIVWQTVPTVKGERYHFSFFYSPRPKASPDLFMVSVNSNTVFSVTDDGSTLTNFNWQSVTTHIVAESNLTTLAFSDLSLSGGGSGTHIDGVVFEHEPMLFLDNAGPNLNVHWFGVSNETYQVQFRTNLVLGNWSNIGSAQPGGNTTNSLVMSQANSSQGFYRIMLGP